MLILGGSIDGQLGKDLQRLCNHRSFLTMLILGGCQSMVNLERIGEDFERITSDNVQLQKDPRILCKDYL